jgi:hypothetical protein
MIFSLEALSARHGDSLFLHYGTGDAPRLAVIDGGPPGVFNASLRPRLDQIKAARTPAGELPIELLMVSHLDDDHIRGVLDLTGALVDRMENEQALPYAIRRLWHNAFDDIVGNERVEFFEALGQQAEGASAASLAVPASVGQGRELRDRATKMGLPVNPPFETLVAAPAAGGADVPMDGGLTLKVIAPGRERVEALQREWDEELEKKGWDQQEATAQAASYLDSSVFNLASIVVVAQADGRSMLLTGDGRGDYILQGLTDAGLLGQGGFHVDLLKLPHHGSSENVEPAFFEQVTADHYVVSGDGHYGNPEVETLQMIVDARGTDECLVHLTNQEDRLVAFFDQAAAAGSKVRPSFRAPEALSLRVDLGDPMPD